MQPSMIVGQAPPYIESGDRSYPFSDAAPWWSAAACTSAGLQPCQAGAALKGCARSRVTDAQPGGTGLRWMPHSSFCPCQRPERSFDGSSGSVVHGRAADARVALIVEREQRDVVRAGVRPHVGHRPGRERAHLPKDLAVRQRERFDLAEVRPARRLIAAQRREPHVVGRRARRRAAPPCAARSTPWCPAATGPGSARPPAGSRGSVPTAPPARRDTRRSRRSDGRYPGTAPGCPGRISRSMCTSTTQSA